MIGCLLLWMWDLWFGAGLRLTVGSFYLTVVLECKMFWRAGNCRWLGSLCMVLGQVFSWWGPAFFEGWILKTC